VASRTDQTSQFSPRDSIDRRNSRLFIEELTDRTQIIEQAASTSEELNHWKNSVSQEIANDFYALGYAYLQTMLMSHQLRYSTNLDRVDFDAKVTAAAEAAIAGDEKQTSDKLFTCFDTLLEEKNSYYPVEPQICELLLTHPNTLGSSLTKQLESSNTPISVLISGQDARKLADKNQPALTTWFVARRSPINSQPAASQLPKFSASHRRFLLDEALA